MKRNHLAVAAAALMLALGVTVAQAQVLGWSTQGTPVTEQQGLRDKVFANFPGGVDYQPQELGQLNTRIQAEQQDGSGQIGVIAGLYGDLSPLKDILVVLSVVDLSGVKPSPAFMDLG